jgi:ribosome-associated translation inhibitor RaiA
MAGEKTREELVKTAVEMGMSKDIVGRTPTYTLESMIKGKSSKREKATSKKGEFLKTSVSPIEQKQQEITSEIRKIVEENKQKYIPDDDTMTVVDMSHVTTTENPADQKFKRFDFLVCAKNQLLLGIKTNSGLTEANREKLDEDDMFVLQKEISSQQEQLNLVLNEMREIRAWFEEVRAQKIEFYEKLSGKVVDISGGLSIHFNNKLEKINKYLESLQKEL